MLLPPRFPVSLFHMSIPPSSKFRANISRSSLPVSLTLITLSVVLIDCFLYVIHE